VLNLEEVMESELMKGRAMVVDLIHESWGAYKQLGIAPKFSLTPGCLTSHAPELGEHTRPILEELGYSAAKIEDLKNSGII
jgi:crotonobetainyl-CoA:carnitine CoA-transferase CaiB-like acyl-CoA transferase